MKQPANWRRWQFSLRSLLLLTAVIALLLGWCARRVERQRHAVAAIQDLGGKAVFEPFGPAWLHQLGCGEFCRRVVTVELPGARAEEAVPLLSGLSSLRKVSLEYHGPRYEIKDLDRRGSDDECLVVKRWSPADADLRRQLPGVEVEVHEWLMCDEMPTLKLSVRARCNQCHAKRRL